MRPLVALIFLLASCSPPRWDTTPPRLLEAEVSADGKQLTLEFDEPVAEATTGGDFTTEKAPARVEGEQVKVVLPPGLKPGKGYQWTAEVKDAGTNLTSLAGRFYGPNDHPAGLRLNEVRIAGSGTHTDLVELRVESPGSLGGWTLEALSGPETRQKIILPDVTVAVGEFVVVHYRPTGATEEKNETSTPDASGGSDADPTAWDFWQPEGKGLSGVKGVLLLRPSPGAAPIDGLVYSSRPEEGTALAQAAGWQGEERSPEGCTATRTWSRTDDLTPNWIITATGGATPGRPNSVIPWAGSANRSGTPKTKGGKRRRRGAVSTPSSPFGPESTAKSEPEEAETGWRKENSREQPTGTYREIPDRPRPRGLARPQIARHHSLWAPQDSDARGEDREEPPQLPSGRPGWHTPPGTGATGRRRRGATRLFV